MGDLIYKYIVISLLVANFVSLVLVILSLKKVLERRNPVKAAIIEVTQLLRVPVFLSRTKPPTWEARAHGETAHGDSEISALRNLAEKCQDKVRMEAN